MSKSLYTTIIEEIAPTTTTVGVVGQLYLDSTTKILYQCVAINIEDLTYEWKQIGGGVTEEDLNNCKTLILPMCNVNSISTNEDGTPQVGQSAYSIYEYKPFDSTSASNNLQTWRIPSMETIIKIFDITNTYLRNTTSRIGTIETNLTEVTSRAMRALLTPVSAPATTELVAVDDGNAQTMIEIGEGLSLENGVLKAIGASDSGEYVTTKKKILAKNDFGLSFPITLSEAIQSGDIIEIRSSDRIYRVMVSSFPQSIDTSDLEAVEGSSSYNTAVFRGKIQISADGTQITSTLASLYWLNIPSSGNVTVNSTDAAINKVYEVAKIIE